jgi:hypothetical protein
MADFDLKLNTIPPAPPTEELKVDDQNSGVEEPIMQGTPPMEEPKVDEPQTDTFFEEMNKRFGAQFKSTDEVKSIFELPKKVVEYENKLKESESLAKSVEDYKKRIEELEGSQDPLKYFASPESYIAEQLRIKYPKNNPLLLQEIATSNVDAMKDFDVLVKEKQLFVNNPPREQAIRAIILKKYGIDTDTNPEEWDELAKAEMQIDAAYAREKINNLKGAIELPKILTREQREQAEAQMKAEREKQLAPMREAFTSFDKFSHPQIPGFEADVNGEYKSKLNDIFKGYFGDSGVPPTKENLEAAVEFRNAFFVYEQLPKLREIWLKEGRAESQKKYDEESHNTTPPNTATATDNNDVKNYKGLADFFGSQSR